MAEKSNSYDVTIIRKVPFLTEFFLFLLIPGAVVIFFAVSYLIRSSQSSNEMQDIFIITQIPEKVQYVFFYLGLSTIILYPLYKYIRIYKTAKLILSDQYISLERHSMNVYIPFRTIRKIYFKEPQNFKGESKEKLIIYIEQTFMKTTTIKLKDYSKADSLINDFLTIDKLKSRITGDLGTNYIDSED